MRHQNKIDSQKIRVFRNMSENIDDEEVREVLSSGTDVREYSQQVEKDFKEVENRSIEDYIKGEQSTFVDIFDPTGSCKSGYLSS